MARIVTDRLILVASNAILAHAEINNRAEFASILNAEIPADWPPPLNDDDSMNWNLNFAMKNPFLEGWAMWYILLKKDDDRLEAIGNCGFKGIPDINGAVEVGYSIMESHHRKGYATEAVNALIDWAFGHEDVKKIIAHTLPDLIASQAVLKKCGFKFVGEGLEEGAIMYELLKQ